tara:strand:- start:120 stop:350 length:231 start_codon:yes stop_codon:yes gene_type:complete
MNEGEYLELVNDLRDQYNDMKEKYEKEISMLKQDLSIEKNKFKFQYIDGQFQSNRPSARQGIYTSTVIIDSNVVYY